MPKDTTKVRAFGPGDLYSAVVGAAEPATLQTAWAGAWSHLGYTGEGSTFTISPNFEDIEVAEEDDPIDVVKTASAMTVAFALAQQTAENLQLVMNGGTIATNNSRSVTIGTTTASAAITSAALFDLVYDVGAAISGTGIPGGATILSVQSASAATLSVAATATGSPSATVVRAAGLGEKDYEPAASGVAPTYSALGWRAANSKEQYVWRKCLQTGDIEIARQKAPAKALLPASFRLLVPSPSLRPFKYKVSDA